VLDPSDPPGEPRRELAAIAARALPAGHLSKDFSCLGCGYNLRTLATDARCPECGFEVALTLCGGFPLVDTRARRRGLAGACAALALAMLSPFCADWWAPVRGTKGPGAWWDPVWGYMPVAFIVALAMVLFALPQHRVDGVPLFRRARRLILATVAACPLALVAWEYAYAWAPAFDFAVNRQLLYVPLLGVAPGILLCFRLLSRLIRPFGAGRYRRVLQIVTAAWWLIVVIATFALLDEVPPLTAFSQTNWHRAKSLVGPLLRPLVVIAEIVVLAGYFGGVAVLAILAIRLAVSRPRDPAAGMTTETSAANADGQTRMVQQ
jgi:hypothetical protein